MYNRNVRVEEIEGWHEDGWCNSLVRGRLIAERAVSWLAAEVWLPAGSGPDPAIATMTFESGDPLIFNIPLGEPFKLVGDVRLQPGQELSLRIFCVNRVNNPEERRQLSFNLLGFSAE